MDLVVTAGLAAMIAAIGGYASERSRGTQTAQQARCEIVARLVEDDRLNPLLNADTQRRIAYMASQALSRCITE